MKIKDEEKEVKMDMLINIQKVLSLGNFYGDLFITFQKGVPIMMKESITHNFQKMLEEKRNNN